MSKSSELPPGTLDLLVLRILGEGPRHGYSIARQIEALSGEFFSVEQGSLYPALHRMEKAGWVRARWGKSDTGRRVRVYSLTRSGEGRLSSEVTRWEAVVGAISNVLRGASTR